MLTPEQLIEFERLVKATSIGPWKYTSKAGYASIWQDQDGGCAAGWCIARMLLDSDLDDKCKEQASKNGPFIAAARNLASPLIETIRELQAENTALKANLSISQQRRIAIQVNERSDMPPLVLSDKVTDSMRAGQ